MTTVNLEHGKRSQICGYYQCGKGGGRIGRKWSKLHKCPVIRQIITNEIQYEVYSKVKNRNTIGLNNSISGNISKRNKNTILRRYLIMYNIKSIITLLCEIYINEL